MFGEAVSIARGGNRCICLVSCDTAILQTFFFRLSPRQDFASYLLTGKPAAGDDGNTADLEELHFGGSSGCRIWVTLGGDMVD